MMLSHIRVHFESVKASNKLNDVGDENGQARLKRNLHKLFINSLLIAGYTLGTQSHSINASLANRWQLLSK